MSGRFRDRVVLVTGGNRGIGKAIARAFADEGAQVTIAARDVRALAQTLDEIGGLAVPCDVGDPASIRNLFQQVEEEFGPVDILVNNAALGYAQDFLEVTPAEFNRMMAVNVGGVFFCAQEMLRRRIGRPRPGQIVNLASLAGIHGLEKFRGLAAYTASKSAVVGLTEALAVEAAGADVRVNGVAPGAIDTEMLKRTAPHLRTETRPEDVAKVVLDLCSEVEISGLTGKTIEIHSNIG